MFYPSLKKYQLWENSVTTGPTRTDKVTHFAYYKLTKLTFYWMFFLFAFKSGYFKHIIFVLVAMIETY